MDKLLQKLKNSLLIPRSDDFDLDYMHYLYDESTKKLRERLSVRSFAVGNTGVAYRVINHWEQKGLLPKRDAEEGWRKFNFVELVWLKTIIRLRKLGFPIPNIVRVKNGVMEWSKGLKTYPILEYFIVKAAISPIDPYIFLLPDGRATVLSSREIEDYKSLFASNDAILISIKSILKELGMKVAKPETLRALSYEENVLLNEVRDNQNSEVKAKIKHHKLRKISEIETTTIHSENPQVSGILSEWKTNGENIFGEILVKVENGRKQSAHIKKVRRFK